MRTTVKTIIAAALIAGAPAVFAATPGDDTQSAPADNMGQMMQDDSEKGHGMGMNNKDMPMMKMMTRMNDMMETCNKMMQSKMENMNGPDGSTDKGLRRMRRRPPVAAGLFLIEQEYRNELTSERYRTKFHGRYHRGPHRFHEWLGDGWGMLMSHPADFTPVCTTELGAVGGLKENFAQRDVKAIVVSVDSVDDHKRWSADIEETQGQSVNFPIIGDSDRKVAELYDMIHPNAGDTSTVRSVFIIDSNKKIRMTLTYPKSAGRNFDEILRVIDSLQLTDNYKVTTPANWQDGDDVIVSPALSNEEAEKLFPAGWNELKPYLRMTRQPNR